MHLGLGLMLSSVQKLTVPVFDPATLSPDGWFRDYAGAPWTETSPAGGPALNSGGTAPTTGTLNTHGTAVCNGSTQSLVSASNAGGYFTTAAFSGWVLCNVISISTNDASTQYNNVALLASSGSSTFYLYLRSAGKVGLGIFDTGFGNPVVEATFATSSWQLVQYKYTSSVLHIRVNGGSWVTAATGGDMFNITFLLNAGLNAGSVFLNGTIAEMGMKKAVISDADFDNIRGYVNSRYGLSV